MIADRSRQILSIALTALFFLGVGAEAYGWHGCPHHHRDRESGPAASETPAAHSVATDPGEGDAKTPGPCTCVGSCHAGATAPHPATGGTVAPAPVPVPRGTVPAPPGLRLRPLDEYFLPYPNAPPPSTRNVPQD